MTQPCPQCGGEGQVIQTPCPSCGGAAIRTRRAPAWTPTARVDRERGTVAGVIANRREEGMRLQIDATVVYAVDGGATANEVSLARVSRATVRTVHRS